MKNKQDIDPAHQSLTEVLAVSFKILRLLMLVLILLFLSSGIFRVKSNEEALIMRFGKIVGDDQQARIHRPGLHWTLPRPFSKIIKIKVGKTQTLELKNFWHSQQSSTVPTKSIDPLVSGYCLAAHANIVHFVWKIEYTVANSYQYYMQKKPKELLQNIACNQIIKTTARHSLEQILLKTPENFTLDIQNQIQHQLELLKSGLKITDVQFITKAAPPYVQESFTALDEALAERNQKITATKTHATRLISEAKAESAKLIAQAKNYASKIEKEAEADADYFEQLLKQFSLQPQIFIHRHYHKTMAQISSEVQEIFILSSTAKKRDIRIRLNRDPQLNNVKPAKE